MKSKKSTNSIQGNRKVCFNTENKNFSSISEEALYWLKALKVITNKLPVILCKINSDGVFQKVTGEGLRRMKMTEADLIGKNIFDVYPQISGSVKEVLNGKPVSFITTLNSNGKSRFFENYYFPENDGSVGFIFDITKRVLEEKKIKKSESLLLEAQSLSQIGIWEWDVNTNKMTWSNELLNIFGYQATPSDINYLDYIKHIHPDDLSSFRSTITKTFQDNRSFSFEHKIKREDGEIRVISGKGNPVISDEGIVRIYGFCQDITERKAIEEKIHLKNIELEKAQKALVQANEELEEKVNCRTEELSLKNKQLLKINSDLDNFVYTASHDLKAPISNIEGLINSLTGILPDQNEEVGMVIEMVTHSINRFKNTIKDLTEVTKIQNLESEAPEEVSLTEVSEEVVQDLRETISGSQAKVEINYSECDTIKFSKRNLRSILYNLVSNAIKYKSPERIPKVVIKSSLKEPGFILVEVKDNGLGFKKEQANKIFTMFKRLHSHVEGSGIGLYLVNRMVQNYGGKIEVESEPGQGSVFKIFFKNQEEKSVRL